MCFMQKLQQLQLDDLKQCPAQMCIFQRMKLRPRERQFMAQGHTALWRKCKLLSCVWLFVAPWTVAHQAPLSVEFSRQEYWSGLLFVFPRESFLPRDPIWVSCIAGSFFTIWAIREATANLLSVITELPILFISYMWNHMMWPFVTGLLCLA